MMRALKSFIKGFVSPKYAYLRRFRINPGDVVIDLGANVGEVSEYFLRKGARVYAYEPNPHAFAVLKARFGNNRNLALHQAAVSNYRGQAKLWLHTAHNESEVEFSQASSLQAEKSNVSDDYVEVPVIDIAEVLAVHPSVKLLKIDIEGGEYDIMDCVLGNAEKIEHVLLETHGEKHKAFAAKEAELNGKIDKSPFKDRIYTDWF